MTKAVYDGLEFMELMTADGVTYQQELGYLPVGAGERVVIWTTSETHGHGGNRFESYCFAMNCMGGQGWIPNEFLDDLGEPLATTSPAVADESVEPVATADWLETDEAGEATGQDIYSDVIEC